MNETDHDLLIRIDINLVAFNTSFQEHIIQDAKQFGLLDIKVSAAHTRLDAIAKSFAMIAGAGSLIGIVGLIIGIVVGIHTLGWW